jgi:hypothetical protein
MDAARHAMTLGGVDPSIAVHSANPFQSVHILPIFLTFTQRPILKFVPRATSPFVADIHRRNLKRSFTHAVNRSLNRFLNHSLSLLPKKYMMT